MSKSLLQPEHTAYMRRALTLARRGLGRVEPNPMVGCVIVKNGRIVGEGYHRRFGGDHAEVCALRDAGGRARGATAYVTLEPCDHYGKTPPCTAALRQAGLSTVVVAIRDPNPIVSGNGIRALRRAGMQIVEGVLQVHARDLNAAYLKRQQCKLPLVIAKWAQTMDGKLTIRPGQQSWVSGLPARRWAHRLRGRMDAIVVGSETVLRDDPLLTCRGTPAKRVAERVVLDTRLRMPLHSRLVQSASEIPTVIFTSRARFNSRKAQRLAAGGVQLEAVTLRNGHVSLKQVFHRLARRGMTNVLLEGGGQVLGSAIGENLVDEAYVFVAPLLMLDYRATALACAIHRPARSATILRTRRIGPDLMHHLKL